jgi:transposase
MITIGVDFHKRTSTYHVLDEHGKKIKRCKLENTRDNIRNFLQSIDGPKRLAMEATMNWGLFYETAHDLVDDFKLGHPKKMKVISESQTKNDKKDAETIGLMAQSNFFPQAHVTSLNVRQLRSLLRYRHFIVRQRKKIRQQVQILIDRNIWPCDRPGSFKNVFCRRGRAWLDKVALPDKERFILNGCLGKFAELSEEVSRSEAYIAEQAVDIPGLKYLRTVPGFLSGKVNVYTVLLEIDNINRFARSRRLCHYAGLIPREDSSGDRHRNLGLVKECNMHLRTALLESALAAIRVDRGLKEYYNSVKARRGSGPAIVAVARKLATAIYYVLKEQRAYRPHQFHSPAADCHSYADAKSRS